MILMPHQLTALDFLIKGFEKNINRAHLDSAGTGKTLPVLLAARKFTPVGKICLYVTLASLKYQLENEVKRFNVDFTPIVVNGTKTERLNVISEARRRRDDTKPVLLIINYEQV